MGPVQVYFCCRSSSQDIGAMLSAFIQQHSGQAPPGAAQAPPAVPAASAVPPAVPAASAVPPAVPAASAPSPLGNAAQLGNAAPPVTAVEVSAAAVDTVAEVPPVMDVPQSPLPPRTPEPPVRPRVRPVDELLRTAASKSMAKARPPVPRNLFSNTPEIAPAAEPLTVTVTPGLSGGDQAGLDGTALEEVRHGDGEGQGGTLRPYEDTRPFCAICQDVMDHQQEALQALPCGHCFHVVCMQNWRHDSCPTCRQHMMMDPWRTPAPRDSDPNVIEPDEDDDEEEVPEQEVPPNREEDELGFL